MAFLSNAVTLGRTLLVSRYLLLLLVWLWWEAVPLRAQSELTEYQVKAAFLYNFAKFVEWPQEAFATPEAPMRLCVLGEDPFESDLNQIVENKSLTGHPVQVIPVEGATEARKCHILFVSSSTKKSTRHILEALKGTSVLTVGDTGDFVRQGGMIDFIVSNKRVRFEVNLKAAESAGLKISSKLLTLAALVMN